MNVPQVRRTFRLELIEPAGRFVQISLLALALVTLSFYWRLSPLIRKLDREGHIEPKNYSTVLGLMIFSFIVLFLLAAFILDSRYQKPFCPSTNLKAPDILKA